VRDLPFLISSDVALLSREDATIYLVSVELQPAETIVHLVARVPDPAAEEAVFNSALERWAAAGRVAPVPLMPGEERFADATVALTDDADTTYPFRESTIAGTGRMFFGDWRFAAPVPSTAQVLTVTVVQSSLKASADVHL
jgi:hypothetical protein